jgi:hypothetical protein
MNINLPNNTVTTKRQPNGNVEFVLGDKGSAFVTLTLYINDNTGAVKYYLVQKEQYSGPLTQSLPLDQGSYPCLFAVQAHRDGALGPVYDSFLKISGNDVATAKGSITTEDYEHDSKYFTLTVT